MVLRLIYQIKKVSDSSPDIVSIEFDDSWSKILSEYMSVCDAAFIKRQVRKVRQLQNTHCLSCSCAPQVFRNLHVYLEVFYFI